MIAPASDLALPLPTGEGNIKTSLHVHDTERSDPGEYYISMCFHCFAQFRSELQQFGAVFS
jgi:hypothetical protein